MATERYDVMIIGGGNAGIGVTVPTRAADLKVALVEPWDLGGTCPNRGCTPKKVLVAAAHALDEIERAKAHGIHVGQPRLDWAALIERKAAMIRDIPAALASTLAKRGVEVIRGQARFVGRQAIALQGGDRVLEAEHIVLATGSTPRPLPIPGAEHLITSDEVLSERHLPAEVVFIGGGVIALEFAHVYVRAGSKVTILEAAPKLLPALDEDAVAQIVAESRRLGIAIRTGVEVQAVEPQGGRLRVVFTEAGREQTVSAERVVNGAGRIPNLAGLALAAGEVAVEDGKLQLGAALRSTTNPAVHACGDVVSGSPQLSPLATYEGRLVGRNIVEGAQHEPDYGSVPACLYTVPGVAWVGLTEQAARARGLEPKVVVNDLRGWLSARTFAEPVAWSKILLDPATDRVLGAQLIGHGEQALIHLLALAMRHGIPASDLRDAIYAFPTFAADLKHML